MSFWARLKFLFGLLFVFLCVALLVLYLNSSMSGIHALQAQLGADTVTVGIDYPGLVMAQNVSEGDKVTKGQTLFTVDSPQLTSDIAAHLATVSSLPFSLDKSGNILVKANSPGIVQKINYQNGSYVPGGAVMTTLYGENSLYISGHFYLSPPDYARLQKGSIMDVTFPDNSKAQAVVYNISLEQTGSAVDTVVEARLPIGGSSAKHFPIGTPVEASLKLSKNTWWQDVVRVFNKLFRPDVQ